MRNFSKRLGMWLPSFTPTPADAAPPATSAPPQRIHHPTITAPRWKCYRVIRHYRTKGALQFEDIGAFRDAAPAILMSTRERGRARVLDPTGKVFTDNFQPIEERTP